MNANLLLLLPHEWILKFFKDNEEKLLESLCRCGIEISNTTILDDEAKLLSRMDYYFQQNTVFVGSLKNQNAVFSAVSNKFAVQPKTHSLGYVWSNNQRNCIFFDANNLNLDILDDFVISYLFYPNCIRQSFRVFGLENDTIKRFLAQYNKYPQIHCSVYTNYLDSQIHLFTDKDFCNSNAYNLFMRSVHEILEDYVYCGDSDSDLSKVLAEILGIRGKNLVICDCLLGGTLVDKFEKNRDVNKFIAGEFTANGKEDFADVLDFEPSYIANVDIKSSEMAYEICAKLVANSPNCVVLCLSGSIDCPLISVGDVDEIHVLKAKHLLNNKPSTMLLTNDCFFKLIKKLNKKLLSFYEK